MAGAASGLFSPGNSAHSRNAAMELHMAKQTQTEATRTLTIALGSAGSVDVQPDKFTDQVRDYIFEYGLKQMLNDAHASITAKTHPKEAERASAKVAMAEKKLASLLAGQVAQARASAERDPVGAEVRRMAEAEVKQAIKLNGKKVGDYAKIMPQLVDKMIEKNGAKYRPVAERVVAERASAPVIEVPDLEDILGDLA